MITEIFALCFRIIKSSIDEIICKYIIKVQINFTNKSVFYAILKKI